jgi:MFS family permease
MFEKKHSFKILVLLVFFSSALIGTLLPMAEELVIALPGLSTEQQVGIIASVFLIVGASSSLVWAILASKFSRKKLLLIATLEWSIAALLTIFATGFYLLLFFQILAAIGFGSVIPITFSLINDLKEPEERGRAFGIKEMCFILGAGLSQVLAGFLIKYYPWFIPFIVISIGGFTCTFLLFQMTPPERGEKDASDESVKELGTWIRKADFREIADKRSNVLILVFNFILFIGLGAVSQYLIALLKSNADYNFESDIATIFLVIIYVWQIPSGVLLGKLGDKKFKEDVNGRVKVVLMCLLTGGLLYIIGFSLIFNAASPPLIIILFLIITSAGAFFYGGIDPLLQATLGDINTTRTRSTIYSINYLSYTFGRSISELIIVWFYASYGYYQIGFIFLSIWALSSIVLLVPLLKTLPRESPKR